MNNPVVIVLAVLSGLVLAWVVWDWLYKRQQLKKAAGGVSEFSLPKPPKLPAKLEAAADDLAGLLADIDAKAKAAKAQAVALVQARQQAAGSDPVSKAAQSVAATYASLRALPDSPEKVAAIAAYESTIGPTMLAITKGSIPGA